MNRILCAALAALALSSPARAEDPPALELAPLVPPRAPWLKKNQKAPDRTPGAQAKKTRRKTGAPAPHDVQPGAPLVAAPPPSLPGAASPKAAEALPLAPLVPPPSLPQVAEPQPQPQPELPAKAVVPAPRPKAPVQAVAAAPAPSTPRASWTRPAGMAALGVGAALAVAGTYFGVKSHSDLNTAESAFHSNGGAYRPGDLAALSSGNSAAHSANALFIASGALLAAGALLTWAF